MPKLPAQSKNDSQLDTTSNDVDQFLSKISNTPLASSLGLGGTGHLIFALDATASRQATWDVASALQADMFTNTKGLASLAMQLVYFRGYDECRSSPWLKNSDAMLGMMRKISCVAGRTQISRVLKHTIAEAKQQQVQALVFIGDAMEENVDELGELAGKLKILGVPVFIFQEGHDMLTNMAFKQIANVSGGAHCHFDHTAANQLGLLLNAVAAYATGGQKALLRLSQEGSKQASALLEQLK